ncbi:hypothetical protein K1T71_002409 [Dendrolimus kikuchii]|uniref:Uncharacterized protein n=1 Tax=Dendrolimus kikuchii TaxID=765133 RepID=A0ACC1DE33_9NEOP|nr:hypothetical protein K1T71_002409 [Dendrolimus kikuchii]
MKIKASILKMNEVMKVLQTAWWLVLARVVSAGLSCLSSPCLHGICIDDINTTYSCYCVDGYTGVQCQTNWDECWSSPCQNGGTCVDGIASYNCSCPDGFIGDNCETNFNECESNPCQNNGTCIDMTNGYVCSCVPGFSGEHCEVDIAVCNSTEEVRCYNGGQCIEGPGFKFNCKCVAGWAGSKCEDQIDECQSNPCKNGGVCIDVHADYMCACAFGYTGKSCEVQIEFCDENSCSNDALCVVEDGVRVCYCVPDFHGERCELQYDECLLGPRCLNGGTCIDGVDNFTCSCPPKLTGPLCECLILDDGSHDCKYVSPTPETDFTYITTFNYENNTEIITTIFTDMPSRIPYTEYELTSTTISTSTEMTTEKELITTGSPTIYTTIIKDVNNITGRQLTDTTEQITEETIQTKPIESEDSKTDATVVECKEFCNATTMKTLVATGSESPPLVTTESYISSITSTEAPIMTTGKTSKATTLTTTKITIPTTITNELTTVTITESVITTSKIDLTTDKMFTDIPIEYPVTEILTPTTITTEAMELTTKSDDAHTTIQSECTEAYCNGHGTCTNSIHGIRCHCSFNYGGRFCEDKITILSAAFGGNSYIAHKLKNDTSMEIVFNAKTLLTDGQIMLVNIAKGVYMQLFINSGLLKFKFSCGYQTMLLSELKTFVNKGYPMKIETKLDLYLKDQHCNATLRLNDTVAMSGGQVANITALDHNATLYLGNAPNVKDEDNKPFIGCIKDLMVNDEKREVFGDAIEAGAVSECSSLSCLSAPCLNGGTCSDVEGGYTCSCTNGWLGEQCNQSVCDYNPCQAGGSCVKHPGSGFLCLCPYGKHGIFCEYNVEITRPSLAPISTGVSSLLIYPLSPATLNSDRFDLRFRFQTSDMDQIALLAFVGQSGRHHSRSQHLALTFVKGYVMLTWNMGSGPRRVFTSKALGWRRGGHVVRVWRRGRSAGLSVDARHNVTGNAPAHTDKMTLLPYLYIGGHPSEGFRDLPHDLPLHNGWRGCIWEVGGSAAGAGRAVGGRGVGQCGVAQCTAKSCNAPRGVCIHSPATYGCICNEGWFGPTCALSRSPCDSAITKCLGRCVVTNDGAQCDCPYGKIGYNCDQDLFPTDVMFSGIRSYLKLYPRMMSSVSLSFEAEIKPNKERGLVLFAETPHFYTTLSLQGGLLEYRWTDRLSGVTSLVRSGVVVSMSQWHSVKAGRYGSRLYVWVDGALSTEAMVAHAYPHTASNASILLGGAKDLSQLPFDSMSGPMESFSGCIRNLHVNNILLTLEQQNIQEGQNLFDCDGTPCGSETCGGGTCVVEGGRARCACAGNRCRRQIGCASTHCYQPRGTCRKSTCVCAAGYTGFYCEQHINVSIPHFDGSSLLSLGRQSDQGKQSNEQRLSTLLNFDYITLNFTTAEPNGLMVWTSLDNDYIGLGLENGYLKMAWSLSQNTSNTDEYRVQYNSPQTTRLLCRLVPRAGYLADGEWHVLVFKIVKGKITLKIDDVFSYVEELGFEFMAKYEAIDMYIGGITQEESSVGKHIFPYNFKGCMDRISSKEDIFMTNYTEVYSENIKSCQLYPPT